MGKHAAREKDGERMENVIFLDIDGVLNSTLWDETHQAEIKNGTGKRYGCSPRSSGARVQKSSSTSAGGSGMTTG